MVEAKKKHKKRSRHAYDKTEEVTRVRLPKDEQVFGVVDVRLGMGKSRIRCADGKERICRVPGALKRRLWVRPGNIVIVKPWEYEGDRKGDIIYNYKPIQVKWLRKNKHLKDLLEQEEF
jgi:translation initiation factor 1A